MVAHETSKTTHFPGTKKAMIAVILICFVLRLSSVDGFVSLSPPSKPTNRTTSKNSATKQKLVTPSQPLPIASAFDAVKSRLEINKEKALGLAFPLALASTASLGIDANDWVNSFLQAVTAGTLDDRAVIFEAEILNDVSHLVSDLLTIVAPALPGLPIRIAAVLGRVLAIMADYIPDHTILPDELLFQVFMLSFSSIGLVQALRPKIFAAMTLPRTYQLRDGKAYTALFEPTGMTWEQFKSLSACAMDWVDIEPHQEICPTTMDGNDFISGRGIGGCTYWLYRGSMDVTNSEGKQLYTHASTGGGKYFKQKAFRGLFGETALLNGLEKSINNPMGNRLASPTKFPSSKIPSAPQARAGPTGATLLRIRTSQLRRLTDHDDDLAGCLRTLLFQGLSSKLAAQFENHQEQNSPSPLNK